jgi:preprotein translocase YajC subunit
MLLPILLFIPLLYLLMIRPQQKRQKQWQQMLAGIKSGDRITTAGGIPRRHPFRSRTIRSLFAWRPTT